MRSSIATLGIVTLLLAVPVTSRSDEIADLKAKLEITNARLEAANAKLEAATAKIATLEKQLAELKSAEKEKPVVAPIGAAWKGKTTFQDGATEAWEWSVMSRDEKKVTFKLTSERNAIWEYDGEFSKSTANTFKIVNARRIKAIDGLNDPPVVGTIVGSGSIVGDKLTVRYSWNNAKLVMEFKGSLKAPTK